MDKSKLAKYESEIIYNLPGVTAVTASLYSALCEPEIKPFTKDDLHQLYDYFKACSGSVSTSVSEVCRHQGCGAKLDKYFHFNHWL